MGEVEVLFVLVAVRRDYATFGSLFFCWIFRRIPPTFLYRVSLRGKRRGVGSYSTCRLGKIPVPSCHQEHPQPP